MALGAQIGRLGKHSAIYGLGGLVSRILAVLLLPLYTRYLSTSDYGKVETLVAATTVLAIVLRGGISSAFFRFTFDSRDPERRRAVLRTSFWFTMTTATAGLAGGLVLPAAMLAAVLMQQVVDGLRFRLPRAPSARFRGLTMAVVVYVAIAYPAGVLAFRGLPRFPGVGDCAATVQGDPFLLVYVHRSSLREAWATADDLASKGFVGVEVRPDGCGRWEVANPDVNTLEQARGHMEDARRVGIEPRLERP